MLARIMRGILPKGSSKKKGAMTLHLTGFYWSLDEKYQGENIENYSDERDCYHCARAKSDECLTNYPGKDHASKPAADKEPASHRSSDMHPFFRKSQKGGKDGSHGEPKQDTSSP